MAVSPDGSKLWWRNSTGSTYGAIPQPGVAIETNLEQRIVHVTGEEAGRVRLLQFADIIENISIGTLGLVWI